MQLYISKCLREQKDAWEFLALWSNWGDFFFFGGLYDDRRVLAPQMDGFTCSASANVRNYNNPTGVKGGDGAECSGESRLVTARIPDSGCFSQ